MVEMALGPNSTQEISFFACDFSRKQRLRLLPGKMVAFAVRRGNTVTLPRQ
jgi:hypothetical protein